MINVYTGVGVKSTGMFLAPAIVDCLRAGRDVIYIDPVDGFMKYAMTPNQDNLVVIRATYLDQVTRLLSQINHTGCCAVRS